MRVDEEHSSVLRVEETVGCRFARFVCDERSCKSARNRSFVRSISGKELVHNAFALGVRQKLVLKPEKSARRHFEFHANTAALRIHSDKFAFSDAHALHNRAYAVGGNIDEKLLHRLALYAVYVFEDDLGCAYAELVAFSTHCFDKNGKVHFASAAHFERVGSFRLINTQRNVFQQLSEQSVAKMTRCDKFTLLAGKRTVVDAEVHFNSRLADFDERHRLDFAGEQIVLPIVIFRYR